jgi:hypothetical protein
MIRTNKFTTTDSHALQAKVCCQMEGNIFVKTVKFPTLF